MVAAAVAVAASSVAAKQVTKANFAAAVKELASHLESCDFVSVAAQRTGGATGWRRVHPVDTAETAYLKAKHAAESFELLQLAVCPFRIGAQPSKLVAFPYNFHLFPRDELHAGMPSYSFSCQSSYLSAMARDGFDFNMCIYDGLSYLSRVQESLAKQENIIPQVLQSSSCPHQSISDSVFMGRIKSRIEHWRKACREPNNTADGSLVNSLRKLILGGESYGSRPSMRIDVCSDRQVQLVLETARHMYNDLVTVVVPDKAGAPAAIQVIFTSSEEDKNLLMMELQSAEDERNLKLRGFRQVIDLMSASHKPVVSYNCLNDFTFIHSKFIAPLPPNLHEFMCSLRMVFSNVLDVSHLWREIGPLRKAKNIPSALSYLQRQFFVPIETEIPLQGDGNHETKIAKNVLRITKLFCKLSILLKINPDGQSLPGKPYLSIEDYSNIFYPSCTTRESEDVDANLETDTIRKIGTENLVFLWGFGETSVTELRHCLGRLHAIFAEDFELKLVDRTCAAAVFHSSDTAAELLREIESESPILANFFSEGLKAAGFDAYRKVCTSGLWNLDLADAFDSVTSEPATCPTMLSETGTSDIYWNSDLMLDLNEYLEG